MPRRRRRPLGPWVRAFLRKDGCQAPTLARGNAEHRKPDTGGAGAGNEALRASRRFGRSIWRRGRGYHRRSRAGTRMHRAESPGQRLAARDLDRQVAEFRAASPCGTVSRRPDCPSPSRRDKCMRRKRRSGLHAPCAAWVTAPPREGKPELAAARRRVLAPVGPRDPAVDAAGPHGGRRPSPDRGSVLECALSHRRWSTPGRRTGSPWRRCARWASPAAGRVGRSAPSRAARGRPSPSPRPSTSERRCRSSTGRPPHSARGRGRTCRPPSTGSGRRASAWRS